MRKLNNYAKRMGILFGKECDIDGWMSLVYGVKEKRDIVVTTYRERSLY